MLRKNDYVIIMAGGIGSRFWPMSRNNFPKQFHDILGTGKTMIQMTWERFSGFIPKENILFVTNERYYDLLKEQLPEVNDSEILLESVGRNTAPCVAYAVFKIAKRDPNAAIMVSGSDYLILNRENFLVDVKLGLDHCKKEEAILTLGIRPTRPDTGYGYIQYIEEEDASSKFFKVKTFTEKPELEVARNFLRSGDFLWNSGMFIFSVKTILDAYATYLPDMYDIFNSVKDDLDSENERSVVAGAYSHCLNISIDNGIMEKTGNVLVIPSSFDWSDLGTWGSVYEHQEQDYLGNAVLGNLIVYDSYNNLIRIDDPEKLVVTQGLHDFIVVDTGDVLLICKKENEQEIRNIVTDVRKKFDEKYS